MNSENNKLIITKKEGIICYGYFRDGIPAEIYCEPEKTESLIGNIYAARVERIAEGIGGAFLEIGDKQKCYYPMSANKQPVKLSSGHKDRLCGGDILLVQITKDAVKTKLPVADSNVSFDGKYFVLTLSDKRYGISKKISSKTERERLKNITDEYKSKDYGIIVRTNAAGKPDKVLREELAVLFVRYKEVMRRAKIAVAKTRLYREPPYYITLGKELPENELSEIVTDCPDIYEELNIYYSEGHDGMLTHAGKGRTRITLYKDSYSLYNLYRFAHFYEEASGKLVWLKSGGSIVIEPTEAMTVVDVNTGSVLKKKRQAETLFYQMNCEAAKEIARQLRLRGLSGIIMIDFINMKEKHQQEELLKLLDAECRKDRIRCRVIDMTALNIVEMVRSKIRRPLHEQMAICRGLKEETK